MTSHLPFSGDPWTGDAQALAVRIAAFIDGATKGARPEPFEQLALDIHAWQAAHDPVLAAQVEQEPKDWQDIPSIPVSLFKELRVGTTTPADESAVFRTSGTTGGGRGTHRFRSTALYDQGSLAWFRACVPDTPSDIIALLHDPTQWTDSSLSHMVALFRELGDPPGQCTWFLENGEVQREALETTLAQRSDPVFLAATAFALADWLEEGAPTPLPAGSVVMVTGGFKGRIHRLDDETLYDTAQRILQPERLVTEYGMTELSSQLWGTPGQPYRPPPWLRVLAVDAISGVPLLPGQRGLLRFVDLCNLDGTIAVETLDEGIVHIDGTVTLLGRIPGSAPRGCSLTVEEAWMRKQS